MGGLNWLVLIAEFIIGLCLCFGGYRFRKYLMGVIWFIIGYLLVKQFGPLLIHDTKMLFLCEILGGLILAVFSFDLTVLSEYLIGLYAGFSLVTSFTGITLIGVILGIIVGIILAFIAQRFSKYIIIVCTAYLGATLIQPLLPVVFKQITLQPMLIVGLLFVVGLIVQLLTNMTKDNYEDD